MLLLVSQTNSINMDEKNTPENMDEKKNKLEIYQDLTWLDYLMHNLRPHARKREAKFINMREEYKHTHLVLPPQQPPLFSPIERRNIKQKLASSLELKIFYISFTCFFLSRMFLIVTRDMYRSAKQSTKKLMFRHLINQVLLPHQQQLVIL